MRQDGRAQVLGVPASQALITEHAGVLQQQAPVAARPAVSPTRNARIMVVAGARPNFVKIAPLMRVLRSGDHNCDVLLVHTGQHYDQAMSGSFFDQLQIPPPDVNLEVGSGSHAQQTGEIMIRFERVAAEWKPDAVVVVGDVNSTIACALVAVKLGIRVAHVEAGLRSFDRTMPEEINRIVTDTLADYLFVTEPSGLENLQREGTSSSKVFLVGNVMIDSLYTFLPLAQQSHVLTELGLAEESDHGSQARPYALLTLHRPSNVDDEHTLRSLFDGLNDLAVELPVLFPAHPRTVRNLEQLGLADRAHTRAPIGERGVWLLPPAGYLEFLHLLSRATLVLTDSGGIQEETTALGVPCLTLRENTERPITVDEGTNLLVGQDPANMLAAAREILAGRGKRGRVPALWDGHAAERIIGVLLEKLTAAQRT